MTLMSTEDLRAMDLLDRAGKRLGEVRDVLLDSDTGRMRFAVVALGQPGLASALGIGERLIPIPVGAVRLETGRIVLSRDAAALAAAPSYARSHPPSFDAAYCEQIAMFWGVPATAGDADSAARDLMAADLANADPPRLAAAADLTTVARALVTRGAEAASVVDERGQVLGVVTLRDIGLALGRAHARTVERAQAASQSAPTPAASTSTEPMNHMEPTRGPALSPASPAPDTAPVAPSADASAPLGEVPASEPTKIAGAPSASETQAEPSADGTPCPRCGARNREGAAFCSTCGTRVSQTP